MMYWWKHFREIHKHEVAKAPVKPERKTSGGGSTLSRVMQLANDTYNSVATLWSPEQSLPGEAKMENEGQHYASVTNKGKRATKAQLEGVEETVWCSSFGTLRPSNRCTSIHQIRVGYPASGILGKVEIGGDL